MLMEPIYNLPKIHIIGGEYQQLVFNFKTPSGESYTTQGYNIDFSAVKWGNVESNPDITKSGTMTLNETRTGSIVEFELLPEDTVELSGRYVYQIIIMIDKKKIKIPGKGILEINRNIHPQYITQN